MARAGRPQSHGQTDEMNKLRRPVQQQRGKRKQQQQRQQQHQQHQQLKLHEKGIPSKPTPATSPQAGTLGAELLLAIRDRKAENWWQMEATLCDQSKKDTKKQSQSKKGGKKALAEAKGALTPLTLGVNTIKVHIQEGEAVLTAAQTLYEVRRSRKLDQDQKWTEKILRQGTLSDKVAALTLLVQEAPLFRLRTLDALLALAQKADRRCAQMAIEALQDLLEHNLLPPERKLVPWARQDEASLPPAAAGDSEQQARREACLALRFFEDQLKQRVAVLIDRLEKATHDTVTSFKRFALTGVAGLLQGRPEQEERLLSILVNKLGDAEKKVAPHAAYLLRRLLAAHPAMKGVVAREVQQFLHRPNLQPRPLYNGISFLGQLYLRKGSDTDLALGLVQTYLSLFDRALKTGGELSEKMLSALLSGVHRATPYLDAGGLAEGPLGAHLEDIFRTVHQASFKTAVQALMLLAQVATGTGRRSEGRLEGRFYRALYEKVRDPAFLITAHPTLFLNLLYKAMKADRDQARVAAFAKRLLSHGALQGPPALAAGVLFLLSEVGASQPVLREALVRRASTQEGEEDSFDPGKREPSFAFGGGEGGRVDEEGDEGEEGGPAKEVTSNGSGLSKKSQPHLWEVGLLALHFHPSVQRFAASVLDPRARHRVTYSGDPLQDFSTMAFLDRFAFKNPKLRGRTAAAMEGEALTEAEREDRLSRFGAGTRHAAGVRGGRESGPPAVNSAEFLSLEPHELSPDQLFFHKFFREKAARDKQARAAGKGRELGSDEDAGSGSEEEEDEEEDEDSEGKDGRGGSDGSGGSDAEEREIDAFADGLAQSLMRSQGKVDFSDEDPDTEAWEDEGRADGAEGDEGQEAGWLRNDGETGDLLAAERGDDDTFLDDVSDDSDASEGPMGLEEKMEEDSDGDDGVARRESDDDGDEEEEVDQLPLWALVDESEDDGGDGPEGQSLREEDVGGEIETVPTSRKRPRERRGGARPEQEKAGRTRDRDGRRKPGERVKLVEGRNGPMATSDMPTFASYDEYAMLIEADERKREAEARRETPEIKG